MYLQLGDLACSIYNRAEMRTFLNVFGWDTYKWARRAGMIFHSEWVPNNSRPATVREPLESRRVRRYNERVMQRWSRKDEST